MKHCLKCCQSESQKGAVKVMKLQWRFTMTEATSEAAPEAAFWSHLWLPLISGLDVKYTSILIPVFAQYGFNGNPREFIIKALYK
jgi:hypothetical protein